MKLLATAVALASVAVVSRAESYYTNNATGDYNVASYWDPNVVPNNNTNSCNNNGSNNVVLIQPGDPVWQHGDTLAGDADNTSGAWLQTGSTNNTGGGNWLRMGLATGSYGSYVLSNGVVNVGGRIQIGERGTGYLEIDGGTMSANVNDTGANPGLAVADGNFNLLANNRPVGTVVINGGTLDIRNGEAWFGNGGNDSNSRGTGHLIMHGGTLDVNNWLVFGRFGAAGDGYMDGGTINKSANGNWQMGVGTMDTNAIGGEAVFTQVGGTINCLSEYQIATDNNLAVATNNIGGNAVLNVAKWLAVGRFGGMGTLNISNNAVITKTVLDTGHQNTITIASGSSVGTINQWGGFVTNTLTDTWIGENGTAYWNMNAGTTVLGYVQIGHNSGAQGYLYLNGGDFTAQEITSGNVGAGSFLYLNGGTIHASVDNPNFIHGLTLAYMDAGGVTIDTRDYNVGVAQDIYDYNGGGLTKDGSGTLTLTGANSYTGPTTISAGTLMVGTSSSGSGDYTAADTAGFGVIYQSAGSQLYVNNLTIGGATGGDLDFDLGSVGNPTASLFERWRHAYCERQYNHQCCCVSDFSRNNSVVYLWHMVGQRQLRTRSLPTGVVANLATNGNTIDLVVSSAGLPRWDGTVLGQWDLGTNQDWYDLGQLQPAGLCRWKTSFV